MDLDIEEVFGLREVRRVSVAELNEMILEIRDSIIAEQAHHDIGIDIAEENGLYTVTLSNVSPERVKNLMDMTKEDIQTYLNERHINFYGLSAVYSKGNNRIKVTFSSPTLNAKEFKEYAKKELFDFLYYA